MVQSQRSAVNTPVRPPDFYKDTGRRPKRLYTMAVLAAAVGSLALWRLGRTRQGQSNGHDLYEGERRRRRQGQTNQQGVMGSGSVARSSDINDPQASAQPISPAAAGLGHQVEPVRDTGSNI